MYHFYIDDSKIRSKAHNRENIGDLVAVGGVVVPSVEIKSLEDDIQAICSKDNYQVPDGENIKWSPDKRSWLRENVSREIRLELYNELLSCAAKHDAKVIVAINDLGCKMANSLASDHEVDATLLALERYDNWLGREHGMVFISKPSGGATNESKFVAECIQHKIQGTNYVKFKSIASNPIVIPASQSRLLQIADLVVSITNAKVAGGDKFADPLFPLIAGMMPETSKGVKGGLGLKIHPSFKYCNLYHWILGDEYFVKGNTGSSLPIKESPYPSDEMKWRE